MKQKYTTKLTLSFCLLLTFFSIGIIIFEQNRSKQQLTGAMEERMGDYASMIQKYLNQHPDDTVFTIEELLRILPKNLRVTIVCTSGLVIYDNIIDEYSQTENHAKRPEIKEAEKSGKGSNIRKSVSTNETYIYYAKKSGDYFIRVALPYNVQVQYFLNPDRGFLYYIAILFMLGVIFIYYIAGHFGKTITHLRDFTHNLNAKNEPVDIPEFSNDELGEIGKQIAKDYKKLKENEEKLSIEHEKLLLHIQGLAEGVCFFTPQRKIAFYNSLFLQYLNILSDPINKEMSDFLEDPIFAKVLDFIAHPDNQTHFETQINKHGRIFIVRINIFEDKHFEIVFIDATKQEKTRLLKQEMTGNIAHELRTPVTGIRGYLETILENQLGPEKEHEFVQKAYNEIMNLSELIRDMSLLAKINEVPDSFQFSPINLNSLILKVKENAQESLLAKDILIHSDLPKDLQVFGNENLIYSIFRNLLDNVINYAGESVTVRIQSYNQDKKMVYISFADNGYGIREEKHLIRLFERFYRVNEGRTRETGGSGLGLSIVKNAVTFHGGNITVKKRVEGGLEFLFNLPKA